MADFLTTGPVSRKAEDLRFLVHILLGEKMEKIKKAPELNKIRIFYMEDDGGNPLTTPVHKDMKNSMKKVLQYLEKRTGVKPQVHFSFLNVLQGTAVVTIAMQRSS